MNPSGTPGRSRHCHKTEDFVSEEIRTRIPQLLSLEITALTGVLINPWADQEGNKLMFLSESCEFPSAPCLAGALLEDHWAQTALRLREMVGYTGVLISP